LSGELRAFADEVRRIVREGAARHSPSVERYQVIARKPLTLEAMGSDKRLVDGEDGFDIAHSVKTHARVKDTVFVDTDEHGDKIARGVLLPSGKEDEEGTVGPEGPPGPEGPKGAIGSTGPEGPEGPEGKQGVKGDTGATGPEGPKGATGSAGATGPEGPEGATGETGAKGAKGEKGEAGISPADWKDSVRVATTANITISTALNNGDSLDGVTLATGDRVLVKNQTTTKENGIWVVGTSPARATDADAAGELSGGSSVYVEEGTVNDGSTWVISTPGSITPGTTSHTWRTAVPYAGCAVKSTVAQSAANASDIAIKFNAEIYDNGDCWQSGNPERFTVPAGQGGIWLFTASFRTTGAAANRYLDVRVNGSSNKRIGGNGSNSITLEVTAIANLNAGDYIEVHFYQETGGTIELSKDEYESGPSIFRASFERLR
jgi:hypothetical protein